MRRLTVYAEHGEIIGRSRCLGAPFQLSGSSSCPCSAPGWSVIRRSWRLFRFESATKSSSGVSA